MVSSHEFYISTETVQPDLQITLALTTHTVLETGKSKSKVAIGIQRQAIHS